MLEYSIAKIIFMLLICKSYTLEYPCLSSSCGITEICYPAALNCRDGKCSYGERCLEKHKLNSHCPYGHMLINDDETPYHCTSNQQCPGQTFCHSNSKENSRVCCWKRDEVQNNAPVQVQNKASRGTKHIACPLPNLFANCDKNCQVDTNCNKDQRCCYNGCGRSCITIDGSNQYQNKKTGVCPVDKPAIFICSMRLRCYTDNDCAGSFICCHISGCGSICRPPTHGNTRRTFTNISTERRNRNQKNSQGRNNRLQGKPVDTVRNLQNFNPQRKPNTELQRNTLRNTPSTNLQQASQFKPCAWFQVLYGGC